ncbi:helix-turn-helix transcriptional regulator [Vibrio scophthalmi]|uniref:helix-turn-helix domain-containing protein n=1 Tax=Vibrio scophthalmi TaxID=45658 RepID=UPI002285179F|nr:helix-turn-helix transcriptional regulator [Vibrio scophthalmi]MCY9805502.1 helix-turn-helix transcriptional regulator [Vibrio scophthalmi]
MKTPLYRCRKKEGISLTLLAEECCSSDSTLSRLERGISKNPSGEVCFQVLERYKKYGLTLEHLIYPERFPDFDITKE